MTSQEAINVLEKYKDIPKSEIVKEAYTMAISALKKQIPKKVISKELTVYSGGTRVLYARCPICKQSIKIFDGHQNNKIFRRDEDVFCNCCGCALDWSDTE